jgi:23S rRNA G2445 N2-methylase RlmL
VASATNLEPTAGLNLANCRAELWSNAIPWLQFYLANLAFVLYHYSMQIITKKKFFITTLPGLSGLAQEQLTDRVAKDALNFATHSLRNNDVLLFDLLTDPQILFRPGIAEDVYSHIETAKLFGTKNDLLNLRRTIANFNFEKLFGLHHTLSKKGKFSISARAVVQAADEKWRTYRRLDIQTTIEKGLALNLHKKFKVVEDDADFEVWAFQSGKALICGFRLTDRTMRHRDYKIANYQGSLRPTVANAMVFLSKPQSDDICLDPMCGAGTILLERAIAGRFQMLYGGDDNPEAVAAALQNFGTKHKPWEITKWDALNLPLAEESVTKIITNPPWGVQMKHDQSFYRKLLKEMHTVLKPYGKLVMIVKSDIEPKLFTDNGWRIERVVDKIHILGQWSQIYVLNKISK